MAYTDFVRIYLPPSPPSIHMNNIAAYLAEKLFVDRCHMVWTLERPFPDDVEARSICISCGSSFPDITDAYRDQVLRPGISKYLPEGSQIFFSSEVYFSRERREGRARL